MDTNTTMGISWTGTLTAKPIGMQHVYLKAHNEHYLIGRPDTTVNNLIIGTMYIEHVGTMTVTNCKTGMTCPMEFSAAGWGNRNKHAINGKVFAKKGDSKALASIKGTWSDKLTYKMANSKQDELLWQCNPLPEKHDWQYYFTDFAINLNNLPEEMKKVLPRTDSRLRPDQRALENNDIPTATDEKQRLEEKQRAARKKRAEDNTEFAPKYFKKIMDKDSNEEFYAYGPEHGMRDYWVDRKNQDFAHMEDLY